MNVVGDITASNARFSNIITAQTLVVQVVSSSVTYSSGSNVFGNLASNTHQFTGSVLISGSVTTLNVNNGMLIVSNSVGGGGIGISGNTAASIADFISAPPRGVFDVRLNADRGIRFSSPGQSTESTISSYQGNVTSNIRSLRLAGDLIYFNTSAGNDPSGSQRMVIDSSGNVGIGTTSPGGIFEVVGNTVDTNFGFFSTTAATNRMILAARNTGNNAEIDLRAHGSSYSETIMGNSMTNAVGVVGAPQSGAAMVVGPTTNSPLILGTYNAERMRITSGAQVLINSTASINTSYKLTVDHSDATGNGTALRETSGASGAVILTFFASPSTTLGAVSRNAATNAVLYNTTSDYRLKEDLKDFNGLALVNRIKTYDFKWKSCNDRMIGVLAHELKEVLPFAVSGEKDATDEDGNIKPQGVDYSMMVSTLVKAIQELKLENDTLKAILQRNNIQ
jgi:hypothetical protein